MSVWKWDTGASIVSVVHPERDPGRPSMTAAMIAATASSHRRSTSSEYRSTLSDHL